MGNIVLPLPGLGDHPPVTVRIHAAPRRSARPRVVAAAFVAIIATLAILVWLASPVLATPNLGESRLPVPAISTPAIRAWLIVSGQFVDVGGHRLLISCTGSGSPTVILEAGLGQPMSTWGPVPDQVAQETRVCRYTRAGVGRGPGRSGEGPRPRTAQTVVNELRTLLARTGVPGPYVLVGHSFGGMTVQLYASQHPDEVSGLVLIDASHEDQSARIAALLPPAARAELERSEGTNGEGMDLLRSAEERRRAAALPRVPAVVLSAPFGESYPGASREALALAWEELQADLARRIPGASHVIAEGSGHFIQQDRPELVVNAITTVVKQARSR